MNPSKRGVESAGEIRVVDDQPADLRLLVVILTQAGCRARPVTGNTETRSIH